MSTIVEILEERVVAAADLIVTLRTKVRSLERELATTRAEISTLVSKHPMSLPDPSLAAELERLRAERTVVRDSIRGLLQEIDRVSW
jgi:protein-tyrosine-phosphatase